MGSGENSGSKSSGLASSASPSGSSSPTATAGTEQAYGPLPRRKVAMGIFCLVAASAIAITLLVQRSLPLGDEGHVGTGTDPPLRLEKGSDTSPDSAGFAMHFARRRRLTTETRKTTRKQPPFIIVPLMHFNFRISFVVKSLKRRLGDGPSFIFVVYHHFTMPIRTFLPRKGT
ncbi:hypothetical protein HPB51_028531 [Rhipicephalus microplus]|uniref:Uncharacterized protein n=1 Tax=Rhipicephalus microplus TaxID=6941 RepID=A0A9J6CX45_RHIMP|nr:hypothetical protein HPB51_028531 [Rhipicephalus microplus]